MFGNPQQILSGSSSSPASAFQPVVLETCCSRQKVNEEPWWGPPQAREGNVNLVGCSSSCPTRAVMPKASFDLSCKTADRNYDGKQPTWVCGTHFENHWSKQRASASRFLLLLWTERCNSKVFVIRLYALVSPGTFLFLGSHIIMGDRFSFKHMILNGLFRVMCDFIAS